MDDIVDLDKAVLEVHQRVDGWRGAGIVAGSVTWRDWGDGWPPVLQTDRARVRDADSIGVALSKGQQEGEVILYKGGWCDFAYWSGRPADDPELDAPGWPDRMTVAAFGAVLDRLTSCFE